MTLIYWQFQESEYYISQFIISSLKYAAFYEFMMALTNHEQNRENP